MTHLLHLQHNASNNYYYMLVVKQVSFTYHKIVVICLLMQLCIIKVSSYNI
jgi:hypothetical protein